MPLACALIEFFCCFGCAIGISIAQNIFSGALLDRLRKIQGIDVELVAAAGAGDVGGAVGTAVVSAVKEAYCFAVTRAFCVSRCCGGGGALLCQDGVEEDKG
jgi:hypothetical protein